MTLSVRPSAVGLDLDGTLIDTMADLAAATNSMLAQLGMRQLPAQLVRGYVGHGIGRLVTRAVSEALHEPDPEPALIGVALEIFRDRYRHNVFVQSRVYPGIPELLAWLAQEEIPACCITNKESSLTQPLLSQAGLDGFFDLVLCADTKEQRKPNPAMLLAACDHFGTGAKSFLYIGDSEVDSAASVAAGCEFLGVRYGFGTIAGPASAGLVDRAEQILELLSKPGSASSPAHRIG